MSRKYHSEKCKKARSGIEEGIIFEADHFAMPRVSPVSPAVSSSKSFAEALEENDIKVKLIASAHSPRVGTMNDLQTAINKVSANQVSLN